MEKSNLRFCYQALATDNGNEWHFAQGLNEMFTAGCYKVRLSHNDIKALLPEMEECDNEHYFIGYLFITESGTDDKLQKERIIGQTLILTSGTGESHEKFTRTCNLSPKGYYWNSWEHFPGIKDFKEFATGLGEAIEWNEACNINAFVTAGTYNIKGERTNLQDNLPISNAAPGHSIHAKLVVLDSSINGSGNNDDKCVTQILFLSNRTGGDGDTYIRTGRARTKNTLAGGVGWQAWSKLQRNTETGTTSSLDNYIDNGTYSGVYTNGDTIIENFVMVVINNYAVTGNSGKERHISQFKYALNIDGTFSYRSRVGTGYRTIEWNAWIDLNGATTAMLQDDAVTSQKLSADVREKVNNPLRPLYIAAGAEYNDTDTDTTKIAPWGETVTHKAGHYYLNGLGDITEEQMMAIYLNKDIVKMLDIGRIAQGNTMLRTMLPIKSMLVTDTINKRAFNGLLSFAQSAIKVFGVSMSVPLNTSYPEHTIPCSTLHGTFFDCTMLRLVYPINVKNVTSISNNTFRGCCLLEELRLFALATNLDLSDSSNITKDSIVYLIEKSSPTSAITITLHPDAYARLADDADVVAALEAQPLVSLVSA